MRRKKCCVYCNMPQKIGSVGRDFYFFFIYFFFCWHSKVIIMLQKRDFIAIISVFSTFHIEVQLFCFLLKQFLKT